MEYNYSKRFYHQWINENAEILGEHLHSAITHWIKSSLEPYDKMWLNYIKNDVNDYEIRKTSVAECMYSSMKSSIDSLILRTNYFDCNKYLKPMI